MIRTDIIMDIGNSINPGIDIGQIEGAFIQGVGLMTMEELEWGENKNFKWIKEGHLRSNGPGNYKIPSHEDIPHTFNVSLTKVSKDPVLRSKAILSSRGIGEPGILLSHSVFFALRDAIRNARREYGFKDNFFVDSPLTSERIRMLCPDDLSRMVISSKEIDGNQTHENFRAYGCF